MELNIVLAGANFRPAEAKKFIKEELNRDTICFLRREPTNAYDANAIQIVCHDTFGEEIFIGYVPKADNSLLAIFLDHEGRNIYRIEHTGFQGTIQPTFRIEFDPEAAIKEVNEKLFGDKPVAPSHPIDDEIPF